MKGFIFIIIVLLHNEINSRPFSGVCKSLFKKHGLTFPQAIEYDADYFGTKHATKNCIKCSRLLKKTAQQRKGKNWKGYFTQKDFDCAIQEAKKNPSPCRMHK